MIYLNGKTYREISVEVAAQGGGDSYNVDRISITPASGVSSITIPNLRGTPKWFMFYPSATVAASSSRRVVCHFWDGTNEIGWTMYSSSSGGWGGGSASAYLDAANFTHSYSNGSLVLSSGGANVGGYYHNTASTLVYGY